MQKLNLPVYELKIKALKEKTLIFDSVRKSYVALTPEEWVRQHILQYLISDKGYPASLLAVEKKIVVNTLSKRCDIVAYSSKGKALLIVECKAPDIQISQQSFDQIARYNMQLRVKYLLVSNGLSHYCCYVDFENNSCSFLQEIPSYHEIK